MSFHRISLLPVCLWAYLAVSPASVAQVELLDDSWRIARSPHFTVYSQVSERRTEQFLRELELWRWSAAWKIAGAGGLPPAAVDNHVYLFADAESLRPFAIGEELGFFYPTPRFNLMAVVASDSEALQQARHHYAHFLIRNFAPLLIPRWYEEGLAGYLANLEVDGNQIQLRPYRRETFEGLRAINDEVSLEELLYDESPLSSPRRVQIANLKSETFLYFLLHGHEEGGTDRRLELNRYLNLSLAGRAQRFAYDQSFELTPSRLEQEYLGFLQESSRSRGVLELPELSGALSNLGIESAGLSRAALANALGELALNSARFTLAQTFYQAGVESGENLARSYSGLADSLRMQDEVMIDLDALTDYYRQALSHGPDRPLILLDYGEYLEALLEDCDRAFEAAQVAAMQADILSTFSRVLDIAPELPEAHLAMAEFYLLEGQDFRQGLAYQARAQEMLPADTFIMEQAVKYRIVAGEFETAELLIDELSQPLHFWSEPGWVTELRERLAQARSGAEFDACKDPADA